MKEDEVNLYASICSTILKFSKRGVEYNKQYNRDYVYGLENGSSYLTAEYEKTFKDIDKRNETFKSELNK